jgi:hypothetical protein
MVNDIDNKQEGLVTDKTDTSESTGKSCVGCCGVTIKRCVAICLK